MTARSRSIIGVLILLTILWASGITERFNGWITDTHWRWRASILRTPFPSDILVVAIDDKSIKKFGRLRNWPRSRYVSLLSLLHQAKAVGFDILITEPDLQDPQGDALLGDEMRKLGCVAASCYEWSEPRPISNSEQLSLQKALDRFPLADEAFAENLPVILSLSLETPISEISSAASMLGTVSVTADSDGIYRRCIPVKLSSDGRLIPSLSFALACIAADTSLDKVTMRGGNLVFGNRSIPITRGVVYLEPIARRGGNYATGLGSAVPTISMVDALKLKPDYFTNKIILIGETASGTSDIRSTPLDNGLRGVELNAEILANLLYISPVRILPLWMIRLLIAIGIWVPVVLYQQLNPKRANKIAILLLFGIVGIMEISFWSFHTIPSWATVLEAFAGSTLLMSVQRYAEEEELKRRLRQSFTMYVAPELVESIIRNPDMIQQEGVRQRTTVLFSDIRDFTAYCEQHEPEFVVTQMCEYLDEMSLAVNDSHGILDKFIGDSVMALFGPFLDETANPDALAILCALTMQDRLMQLNNRWTGENFPSFRVGIGIHSGDTIVGNIGTPRRMQYTALGDTVNLASRLEGVTKELHAVILVSRIVKDASESVLDKIVEFIPRGEVSIRGHESAVEVFEVIRKRSPEGG